MNKIANTLKISVLEIIDEKACNPEQFVFPGITTSLRKCNLDFPTLIRFILFFGNNSLGHEMRKIQKY